MALLNIPDETYSELSARAAARQLSVEEYVLPLLAQPKPEPQLPLTGAAWDAAMDAIRPASFSMTAAKQCISGSGRPAVDRT